MIGLKALIDQTNQERPGPVRKTPEECRIKFLSLIEGHTALVNKAISEMQQSTYLVGGVADYDSTVDGFDELWRAYMSRGDIKPRNAEAPREPSNRVDANMVAAEEDDLDGDGNALLVYNVSTGGRVKICWKCKGIGHTKLECPSAFRTELGEAIRMLQAADPNEFGDGRDDQRGGRGGVRSRFFAKRKGGARGGKGKGKGRNTFAVECDADGNVYDAETWELIGNLVESAPSTQLSSSAKEARGEERDESAAESLQAEVESPASAPVERNPLVWSGETMMNALEEEDLWDMEHVPSTKDARPRSYADAITATIVGSISALVVALAAHLKWGLDKLTAMQASGLVLMLIGALISCVSGAMVTDIEMGHNSCVLLAHAMSSEAHGGSRMQDKRVIDWQTANLHDLLANDLSSQGKREPYCNLDTGTTKPASGDRSKFPDSCIVDRNPRMHVRVASGMRLRVAFIGVMVIDTLTPLRAASPGHPATTMLGCVDGMYVPSMPPSTTLVSTKSLFRQQGVKSYFNDELVVKMPNGTMIEVDERELGYFLTHNSAFDARELQPCDIYCPLKPSTKPTKYHRLFSANGCAVHEASTETNDDLLHQRLCHFSFDRIHASAHCTTGCALHNVRRHDCSSCVRGGTAKKPTPPVANRQRVYTRFGQRVSSDSCAMPKSTPFGFENMVTFYDAGTKTLELYYTKGHSNEEMRACHMQFEADYKEDLLWCGGHVLEWHVDNHGEFISNDMDKYLAEIGVRQRSIVPWNPQQNPAERANSIVLRPLRICLAHADTSVRLWPFFTNQIKQVHNSLANRSATASKPGRSPYEMRTGRLPDVSIYRVLGCEMYATVRAKRDLTALGKLHPRIRCVHLGWDEKRHGYYGYCLDFDRLTTFRRQECDFNETTFPRVSFIVGEHLTEHGITRLPSMEQQESDAAAYRRDLENHRRVVDQRRALESDEPDNEVEIRDGEREREVANPDGPPSNRTRARLLAAGNELAAFDDPTMMPLAEISPIGMLCLSVAAASSDTPSTYFECLQTPEADDWRRAYTKHMQGKMANKTCTFVALPDGATAIKSKLVPAIKYNQTDNTVKERTLRWVACGYSQVYDKNYRETFTATSKATSIRLFANMLLVLKLIPKKTDVPKAFTRADIDYTVFVEQPEPKRLPGLMCSKKDKHGRYYVALLHKALEGLKQAGNLFQGLNTATLIKIGFKQFVAEPTIFVLHCSRGIVAIIVWIDDFGIGVSSEGMFMWFVKEYKAQEGMDLRDEGMLTQFAGVEFHWGDDYVELGQGSGIERGVLRYFPQAAGLTPTQVPATVDLKTRAASTAGCNLLGVGADRTFLDKYPPFLCFIALALYYAHFTRGDLLHVVVFLCRFMSDPNEQCLICGVQLMACLYHTRGDRIRYSRQNQSVPKQVEQAGLSQQVLGNYGIYAMPDSSWKIRKTDALNMTYGGHVIFMNNGALDWMSKLIKVICHSSAEAEVSAGCKAGKRMAFVRSLVNEFKEHGLGNGIQGALIYLIDNSATECLTKNVGVSATTEHFLRWQQYLRWQVTNKYAIVIWINTDDETGDIMTKVLPSSTFLKHKKRMLGKI